MLVSVGEFRILWCVAFLSLSTSVKFHVLALVQNVLTF